MKRITLSLIALCLPMAAQNIMVPNVPAEIRVPAGHSPFLRLRAIGTQNYVCLPSATGMAWKFQGPQATLYFSYRWMGGTLLQQAATHYLSPNPGENGNPARATWQSSSDSSSMWAKKIAESNDPAHVAPGAIPWFLLQTAGAQAGPTGGTMLAQTTYMQRIDTTGGVMPQGACPEPGAIQFVPYTADYVFYRADRK